MSVALILISITARVLATLTLLALMATMRETVILRGEVHALTQVITEPPDPRLLGAALPAAVQELLPPGGGASAESDSELLFTVFLSSECGGCVALADDLVATYRQRPELAERVSIVLTT